MSRAEAIEAMARAMRAQHSEGKWEKAPQHRRDHYINLATDAYDALLPHLQAERERVREMCAGRADVEALALSKVADEAHGCSVASAYRSAAYHCNRLANALRALDIGGQDDGVR